MSEHPDKTEEEQKPSADNFDRSKIKCFHEFNARRMPSGGRHRTPYSPQCIYMKRIDLPDPFQLGDDFVVPTQLYTVSITRHKSTNFKGKRTIFQLVQDNEVKYSAKFKISSDSEGIPISQGLECHLSSQQFIGFLMFSKNLMDFSFRKGSKFNQESMTISFRHNIEEADAPRNVQVFFFQEKENRPMHLISEHPTFLEQEHSWEVDLNSNDPMESIKNAKLIDDDNNSMMYIRKMEKNRIEVEGQIFFEPLELFVIGMASFLCKQ